VTYQDLLRRIDHAVISPEATETEIEAGVDIALHYGVASLFVPPFWLPQVVRRLEAGEVVPGATCGFPLGVNHTAAKTTEAYDAILAGARELDMVINYSALRSGYHQYVRADIAAVVRACGQAAQRRHLDPVVVKVILETCYLTEAEKRQAAELAVEAGADFVKTSTGLGPRGATAEDVRLLRSVIPDHIGVKAAGGIRSVADCLALLEAGADRLGTSATEQIATELASSGS
jgi:deoxyribose-phosphate aldolase